MVERGSRKQEEGMEKTNSGTGGEVKDDESGKKRKVRGRGKKEGEVQIKKTLKE